MFRKMLSMILAALMLLSSACMAEAHTHAPADGWDRDLKQHWRVCECGEKLEAAEHEVNEGVCTVCGSEIWVYDDGSGDVFDYSEYGDMSRYSYYDAEGNVIDDYIYVAEYDAEGNKVCEETYWGDFLSEVIEYAMGKSGYLVPTVQKSYDPEGGWSLNEYDEYGSVVRSVVYDAEENLVFEETSEYVYDEEGWVLHSKHTGRYAGGESFEYEYNEYGDETLTVFYAADGEVEYGTRSEYGYDENGNRVWWKAYELPGDWLRQESTYAVEENEEGIWHYEKFSVYYEEDGARSVYEYDRYGNEQTETVYGADGEVTAVYRNEYEFDENGNILLHKRYENDRLIETMQYEIVEEEDWGWHYMKISMEHFEDGSMYICEYDKEGNEISAGLFDQNGDPVPEEEAE